MSSRDEQRRTVPKFGSFKPKAPSKPESEASPDASRQATTKQPHESRKLRDQSRIQERTRPSSRLERDSERSRLAERASSKNEQKPAPAAKNDVFTIDKRGDPLILRYGSNDRARVPPYRRFGSGKLLGSGSRFQTHQDGAREEFSIKGYNEGTSAFRDRNIILAAAARVQPRRIKRLTEQPLPPGTEDFIALAPPRKRKRGADESESSDEERRTYRSIEEQAKAHDHSDSDFETDSDGSDRGKEVYYVTPTKRHSIQLSQRVKEKPDDTDAWLELIHLQDELFRENEDDGHVRSKDEAKGLANLKLSMFEKALPHASSSTDKERLLIGYMREGSKVWNPQVLGERWVGATDQNRDSFALWRARMDFELTNLATFSYEKIKQLFVDRLRFLAEALERVPEGNATDVADQAVYVFLGLTRFLCDSGFVDLAVGAWQGMLELHSARPTLDEDSKSAAMASFADFWESEAPRIGESGAQGWTKFAEEGDGMAEPPETKRHGPRDPPQTRDVCKAWAATERQRALEARMPARIADEEDEGDPYRVVMVSDISPFLFFFPSALLPRIRHLLLDAYLLFCALPPAFMSGGLIESALDDPFIYGSSHDFKKDISQVSERIDDPGESQRQPPTFKQDGSRMAISPEVLFSGPAWFSYLKSWRELYEDRAEPIERSFILHSLRQLIRVFGVEDLAEYTLALEWLEAPAGSSKVAKAMLRQYPSNTRLYNAYALLEWGNGNSALAQKVLASVISQGLSSGPATQFLWNTWAWMGLEAGEPQSALGRLCSSIDGHALGSPPPPSLLLKARSHFSGRQDYSLSAGAVEDALEFAMSLTLLDYLSVPGGDEPASEGQGNIFAAVLRLQAFSDELSSRTLTHTLAHERFLQFAARLLYFHASHGPFRPVFLREHLQRFVTLFPRNTIFLSLFSWAESSLRIDDPVRAILQQTVLAEPYDCVSSRIFGIRHELRLGNAHSARAAFEGAVGSEACKGNAQLWICYVRFCYSRKELRARTKDVFYRAVTHCPGSKELYMEAFTTLIKNMNSSELKAVFSMVTDKGLRIHVDLEEFMQAW